MEEAPTLRMQRDPQTKEIILSGVGQLHIEVTVEKLKRKFGVEVELKAPKVPYKETIKGSAKAQGRLKKQTGGGRPVRDGACRGSASAPPARGQRPVRRPAARVLVAAARLGLRVRRRHRRRRHPPPVHSGGGEGRA